MRSTANFNARTGELDLRNKAAEAVIRTFAIEHVSVDVSSGMLLGCRSRRHHDVAGGVHGVSVSPGRGLHTLQKGDL
jgi:hypothetical protein